MGVGNNPLFFNQGDKMDLIIDPRTKDSMLIVPMADAKYHIVRMESEVRACGAIAFLDDFAIMRDVRTQELVESTIQMQRRFDDDYKRYRSDDRVKAGYAKVISQLTVRKNTIKSIVSHDNMTDVAPWVLRTKEDAIEAANTEEVAMNRRRLEESIRNYKNFKDDFKYRYCKSTVREEWNKLGRFEKWFDNESKWTDARYNELVEKFDLAVLKKWLKDNKDIDMDELEALL
jgi:hypothetical protein